MNCSRLKASDRSWVFACEFSVSVIQKYLPQMYLLVYRRNNNDIFNFSALSCGFLAVFFFLEVGGTWQSSASIVV